MDTFTDAAVCYHSPDQYLTLLSGLPANISLFSAKKTPVSRIKLEQKLTTLEPHHRQLLSNIESVLQWGYLSPQMKHDQNKANALQPVERIKKVLAEVKDRQLNTLVRDKLDFRSLVGALRHRHDDPATVLSGDWTVSRFKQNIENNWQEPYFRLEHACPWLPQAKQHIDNDEPLLLEKLLLQTAWQHLSRPPSASSTSSAGSAGQEFSFYAVVIYVLKWNIVERWTRYDSEAASLRFQQLIHSGLNSLPKDFQGDSL